MKRNGTTNLIGKEFVHSIHEKSVNRINGKYFTNPRYQ